MNSKAAATPAPAAVAPAEPTLADALAVMEAARVQDRGMTSDEERIVGIVMSRADRPAAMAIHEAGRLLDIAAQGRRAHAAADASQRAQYTRQALIAGRAPAFAELPPYLQLAWVMCERAGGRGTSEGRQLCRMLEDVTRAEQLAVPDCFQPVPAERP